METALLFEHLVNETLNYGGAWLAGMYRGCLRETDSYNNGVAVGKAFALIQVSIDKLLPTLSQEKQIIVTELLSIISEVPTIEDLDEFLSKLNQQGILF